MIAYDLRDLSEPAMDVRWDRQKSDSGTNGRGVNLVAVLVANPCTADKTEKRGFEQLGVIGEHFLRSKARDLRAFHQGLFWTNVDHKLDLLRIDPSERQKIESKISETVPRPNPDWALWSVTCIPRYDP